MALLFPLRRRRAPTPASSGSESAGPRPQADRVEHGQHDASHLVGETVVGFGGESEVGAVEDLGGTVAGQLEQLGVAVGGHDVAFRHEVDLYPGSVAVTLAIRGRRPGAS